MDTITNIHAANAAALHANNEKNKKQFGTPYNPFDLSSYGEVRVDTNFTKPEHDPKTHIQTYDQSVSLV